MFSHGVTFGFKDVCEVWMRQKCDWMRKEGVGPYGVCQGLFKKTSDWFVSAWWRPTVTCLVWMVDVLLLILSTSLQSHSMPFKHGVITWSPVSWGLINCAPVAGVWTDGSWCVLERERPWTCVKVYTYIKLQMVKPDIIIWTDSLMKCPHRCWLSPDLRCCDVWAEHMAILTIRIRQRHKQNHGTTAVNQWIHFHFVTGSVLGSKSSETRTRGYLNLVVHLNLGILLPTSHIQFFDHFCSVYESIK